MRLLTHWLPLAAYAGAIFLLSGQPVPRQVPQLPLLDKLLHLMLYAGLGWFCCRALTPPGAGCASAGGAWRRAAMTTLLCTLYGLSDEWHQLTVPTRSADALDVLADLAGGLAGALLFQGWERLRGAQLTNGAASFKNRIRHMP